MTMNLKTLICVVLAIFANASQADAGLAKSKNCFACHAVDKTVMGPSYKDVAAKYAGNKEAASLLAAKIRNGGEGVWGSIPMPPHAQVSEAQALKLANWILATK
jgi:cytochrome c